MQAVRASISLPWKGACIIGGWLMVGLARLFLAIGTAFQWIGHSLNTAGRWLFARARRITGATGAGGA